MFYLFPVFGGLFEVFILIRIVIKRMVLYKKKENFCTKTTYNQNLIYTLSPFVQKLLQLTHLELFKINRYGETAKQFIHYMLQDLLYQGHKNHILCKTK